MLELCSDNSTALRHLLLKASMNRTKNNKMHQWCVALAEPVRYWVLLILK
jgi:hypothetical protein